VSSFILHYSDPQGSEFFLGGKWLNLVLLALMVNLLVTEDHKSFIWDALKELACQLIGPAPLIFETFLDHNKNAIRGEIVDIFHHLSSPSNGFSIAWIGTTLCIGRG